MKKWHRLNLKIKDGHKFYIDLAIIDLVIGPVVEKFKLQLGFWSFHRSMTPNDGHRLKFNFYTTSQLAEKIFNEITLGEHFSFFLKNYLEVSSVKLTYINNEKPEENKKIELLADNRWPIAIQKSWPHYIKGVCETYLALIKEIKEEKKIHWDWEGKKSLEDCYKKVDKEITKRWSYCARHAYFHHMGIVFGNHRVLIHF